jgi:hypothetical protein
MSCARGCCETQAEHYRAIRLSNDRKNLKKVTRDHHDGGAYVDVTTHWHDREDVNVHPKLVEMEL